MATDGGCATNVWGSASANQLAERVGHTVALAAQQPGNALSHLQSKGSVMGDVFIVSKHT
jgi:hypothetical protein